MNEEFLAPQTGNSEVSDYTDVTETEISGVLSEDSSQPVTGEHEIELRSEVTGDKEAVKKEGAGQLSPETVRSLMKLNDDPYHNSDEKYQKHDKPSVYSDFPDQQSEADSKPDLLLSNHLESRINSFEAQLKSLQAQMEDSVNSSSVLLSSFGSELQTRADKLQLQKLKQDFDHLSKKLKRVVQAEDSVSSEALDATKVPPDVLEITYAKTLNDLYGAMLKIYGDSEASDMVEDARESVRQFSAGVDFFRFEEDTFIIRGLSEAIASKIVSVKQIHGTYIELFKMLFQYVPNYNSQDFRAFVETGSREYTIEKVVSHEGSINTLSSDFDKVKKELSNITENVTFIAELQNNQIEEVEGKSQELDDIREQMQNIARAVNIHTRALNKLNKTLIQLKETLPSGEVYTETPAVPADLPDLGRIEEMVGSKAEKDEMVAIAGEFESFKANVESMLFSLRQQLEEGMLNASKKEVIEEGFMDAEPDMNELLPEMQEEFIVPALNEQPSAAAEVLSPKITDLPIEEVISSQLSVLGSATLKQLEKHIKEQGYPIDFEKLSLVMAYLEQEKLVDSVKKGRYTFYSVTSAADM